MKPSMKLMQRSREARLAALIRLAKLGGRKTKAA